uniref:Uncharacterized protein n=1 Tax=Oryza glumipatula TaxID=40148 RepID=A0A0D9Z111_9ORYZ
MEAWAAGTARRRSGHQRRGSAVWGSSELGGGGWDSAWVGNFTPRCSVSCPSALLANPPEPPPPPLGRGPVPPLGRGLSPWAKPVPTSATRRKRLWISHPPCRGRGRSGQQTIDGCTKHSPQRRSPPSPLLPPDRGLQQSPSLPSATAS